MHKIVDNIVRDLPMTMLLMNQVVMKALNTHPLFLLLRLSEGTSFRWHTLHFAKKKPRFSELGSTRFLSNEVIYFLQMNVFNIRCEYQILK